MNLTQQVESLTNCSRGAQGRAVAIHGWKHPLGWSHLPCDKTRSKLNAECRSRLPLQDLKYKYFGIDTLVYFKYIFKKIKCILFKLHKLYVLFCTV